MTDRELMQQALDALEGYARNCRCEGGGAPCDAAEALRAQLAQPEPEPAAYMDMYGQVYNPHELNGEIRIKYLMNMQDAPTPLYYAPPQREWRGLTEYEVGFLTVFDGLHDVEVPLLANFIRHIEAKLKEKNGF